MFGGIIARVATLVPKIAGRVIPRVSAEAPRVVTSGAAQVGKSGLAAESAGMALAKSTGQVTALRAAGIAPTVAVSPWAAVPTVSKLKAGAAVLGAGAVGGVGAWEVLKSKLAPPKYDIPPTIGEAIPGAISADAVKLAAGVKSEGLGEWLGGLISNPAVRYALLGSGIGAVGLGGVALARKLRRRKKKVKKARRKVRRIRRRPVRRYPRYRRRVRRRRVRRSGRPGRTIKGMKVGSHRWMAYIRGLRKGGKRRKRAGKEIHERIKARHGVTAGMLRQQKKMRAGARTWRRLGKRGSYKAFMTQYLRRGYRT